MARRRGIQIFIAIAFLGLLIFFDRTEASEQSREFLVKIVRPGLWIVEKIRGFANERTLSKEDAQKLENENKKLIAENFELEELREENSALRKALKFLEEKISIKGANVIYYGNELGREFLVLDQGNENGINEGMVVIDENGFLVGIIKKTAAETSRVEVASNSGETFEVQILPLGAKALAKGIGNRSLILELIPLESEVHNGDTVILTSVQGVKYRIYAGSLVNVRTAGSSAFKHGTVVTKFNPDNLKRVFILDVKISQ